MSLSYIYKYRSLRQIIQHNTNSKVQIRDFILKAIKYHTYVNIKIMMDNDISHPFNTLPLDTSTKQLIHPVSKTNDIHRTSQQFFQFAFQMGEREALASHPRNKYLHHYFPSNTQLRNSCQILQQFTFFISPFPQHILPDPIPNARYIRPVHEREVRQEGADEGTALDQLEGRRVVG